VGADAAARVLGAAGGTVVSLIILLSIVDTFNGCFMTIPRVYFAQAADGLFFRWFARIHPRLFRAWRFGEMAGGGPGAGYLYVRPGLRRQLQPTVAGWMAHRHPFDFEPGPINFADDAFRLLNGTPNIPARYSARSGYEIISLIGVEAIRAKSLRQTLRLIDLADEAGFSVRSCRDPHARGEWWLSMFRTVKRQGVN
jgi:hypothetical protein